MDHHAFTSAIEEVDAVVLHRAGNDLAGRDPMAVDGVCGRGGEAFLGISAGEESGVEAGGGDVNRRQGIIAVLCNMGAWMTLGTKPADAQSKETITTSIFTASKSYIMLSFDDMAENAFVIRYKGREVKLSADEIMDALEKK